MIENKKSKVLYVRDLNVENLEVVHLYNLFSCFGNIETIILIREKETSLISFENTLQASIAKNLLNNMQLMGRKMRIFYSRYEKITLEEYQQTKINANDIFKGDDTSKRNNNQLNPPSNYIHVSNLKSEASDENTISHIFTRYGTVE